MSYAETLQAAEARRPLRHPDEIAAKLQTLRDVGAQHVLLNSVGGAQTLRRFAREVLPALAGAPLLHAAR